MIEDATCSIKLNCGFYDREFYTKEETVFYFKFCQNKGEGCGLKYHHDLTQKLRLNEK